jgi:hypothetical protein
MGHTNHELRRHNALISVLEVGRYGLTNIRVEWCSPPTRGLTITFFEEEKKQFTPVRHPEFFKDMKQVILYGVLA